MAGRTKPSPQCCSGLASSIPEPHCALSVLTPAAAAVAPEIQAGPEEVKALLNSSAVLPCLAEGWPQPRVTWRKDGQLLPLPGSDRYEAPRVGGTKSWCSDHVTLRSNG